MKKIITMLFLSLLVSSVFAVGLKKITNIENEEMGIIAVYFDYDEREPFYINTESIEEFIDLKKIFEEVEILFIEDEEMDEYLKFVRDLAIENNCYYIFMVSENWYNIELRINIDDSVTVYYYR